MNIAGKEITFDMANIDDAKKFEDALKNMAKTEETVKNRETVTEVLEGVLNMFKTFFKDATGQDVLEGCRNVEEAKKTYYEFLQEVSKQGAQMRDFQNVVSAGTNLSNGNNMQHNPGARTVTSFPYAGKKHGKGKKGKKGKKNR